MLKEFLKLILHDIKDLIFYVWEELKVFLLGFIIGIVNWCVAKLFTREWVGEKVMIQFFLQILYIVLASLITLGIIFLVTYIHNTLKRAKYIKESKV